MPKKITPKKLQIMYKYEEALEAYIKEYTEVLKEDDLFLSALYMDEIVRTIILKEQPKSESELRKHLTYHRKAIPTNLLENWGEDVEIAMRKRFPEKYKVEKE